MFLKTLPCCKSQSLTLKLTEKRIHLLCKCSSLRSPLQMQSLTLKLTEKRIHLLCKCSSLRSPLQMQSLTLARWLFLIPHFLKQAWEDGIKKAYNFRCRLCACSDRGRIRTPNPQSRNLIFYPVELRGLYLNYSIMSLQYSKWFFRRPCQPTL